jgi:ribokinase
LFLSDGKPGRTVSLEFSNKGHVVNIMLSDIGDNENFGPEKLGQKEQSAIQNADAIIVANWASNERGTDLSKFVFEKSTKSLHFLDPAGDPRCYNGRVCDTAPARRKSADESYC